jgi:hypothetical protein
MILKIRIARRIASVRNKVAEVINVGIAAAVEIAEVPDLHAVFIQYTNMHHCSIGKVISQLNEGVPSVLLCPPGYDLSAIFVRRGRLIEARKIYVHPIHASEHPTVNALNRADQAGREIEAVEGGYIRYFEPSVRYINVWTELQILSNLSVSLVLKTETQEDKQYYSDQ